ncbi:50S ribosomal protein L11 methyltransferase, partial [Candidatus Latescibacterota bacterium]
SVHQDAGSLGSGPVAMRVWPYVAVILPPQAADGVAQYCFDLGSCGAHTEDVSEGTRLIAYYPEGTAEADICPRVGAFITALGLPAGSLSWGGEEERDWLSEWRRFYQPVWATRRIVVHPSWIPVAVEGDQIAIAVDPKMAFGTGGHESTQLSLTAIESLARPGQECLDLGTGSGVLAIALVRLGAARVVAADVDPVAVDNARQNAAANLGSESARVEVRHTDGRAVPEGDFDLVVANIESRALRPLIIPIRRRLAPGGVAIFSGVLVRERPAFEDWLSKGGMAVSAAFAKNEWLCLATESVREVE